MHRFVGGITRGVFGECVVLSVSGGNRGRVCVELWVDDGGAFGGVENEFFGWYGVVHDGVVEGEHVSVSLCVEYQHASDLGG